MWPLEGAMIQSLCVDWRKDLICVWSVNNRTHCSLYFEFIKFIRNCLSCQNHIVIIISQLAICNSVSNTGRNYKGTLDSYGKLSIKYNMNN